MTRDDIKAQFLVGLALLFLGIGVLGPVAAVLFDSTNHGVDFGARIVRLDFRLLVVWLVAFGVALEFALMYGRKS